MLKKCENFHQKFCEDRKKNHQVLIFFLLEGFFVTNLIDRDTDGVAKGVKKRQKKNWWCV